MVSYKDFINNLQSQDNPIYPRTGIYDYLKGETPANPNNKFYRVIRSGLLMIGIVFLVWSLSGETAYAENIPSEFKMLFTEKSP